MSTINAPSGIEVVSEQRPAKRVALLLGILVAFAPLLTFAFVGEWLGDGTVIGAMLTNLAYVMSILSATAVLKWFGSGWREIGLARPASWPKTMLLGVGVMVGSLIAALILQAVLQNLLAPEMAPADRSNFNPMTGNLPLFLLMLVVAWTTAAFGEEMMWRAFLINSLAGFFPHSRTRWALALVSSSLFFGLAHSSNGLAAVAETAIIGLFIGFVYLRTGRNLWVTIIAHGLLDTLAFVLIYSGAA
ncbi:MAG TPA: type II CAAX endopeptidase family protein [Anaerolineae bacterium]|jgi:membrane protease YdiL (CAAX protease family)|nr:type II CAAX endopeptidase family protein [Anaerolineae bacterium]